MSQRQLFSSVGSCFCNISPRHWSNSRKCGRSREFRLEPLERRMLLTVDTILPADAIHALDADRADQFGEFVAMSDDGLLAVVGASKDDEGGKDAGAAYLLHYDGTSWGEVDKLPSSSPREGMGHGVAITGTVADATVVVGTSGSNTVSVFSCTQTGCGAAQALTASTASDAFGQANAIAISRHANGETLVIGDSQESGEAQSAGAAFVFDRNGGGWSQTVRLIAETPAQGETFGWSTAISQDGTTIAIGARGADEFHVFERSGTSNPFGQTDLVATITANSENSLGWDADLSPSGDILVGSALWETFVTTRGSGWSDRTLGPADRLDPGQQGLNRFGWSVDVNSFGDTIAVGTAETKAFVFTSNTTCATPVHGFCLHKNLVHNDPDGEQLANVATDGSTVLAGDFRYDLGGNRDAGAVHVFDLDAVVLPTVTIEATDASAAEENEDPGSFTVTRTGDTSSSLEVFYSVAGSATPGDDYTALSPSVTIPAGSASAVIQVSPIDDAEEDEGTESVIVTVTNDAAYNIGAANSDTVTIADNDSTTTFVDDYAVSEVTSQGTLSGSLDDTQTSDNVYEQITEELYAGNKRSRLEHQWTFDVTGGSAVTFYVEAYHDSGVEDFTFEYSVDGSSWTTMVTVTKTTDDNVAQTYDLPSSLNGNVIVRVKDTDRSQNENSTDSVFIDEMFIRSLT